MSTRSDLEDAIRSWLVAAGASGGIATPDERVIMADQDGVRPDLPYAVVRVNSYDDQVAEDEDIVDDAATPTYTGRGQRTASVSVNAFGAGAEAWLERAVSLLGAPSVRAILDTAEIAVRVDGPINNLSGLLDDGTQLRFQRDFAVDYELVSDSETMTELGTVEHADTWSSPSSADRTATIDQEL